MLEMIVGLSSYRITHSPYVTSRSWKQSRQVFIL